MSLLEISQLLGNFGEFLGASAIVVTLIYLAIQVRQNTAIVRASAYQTWGEAVTAMSTPVEQNDSLGRTVITGLMDPANLTDDNWFQYALWCQQFVLIAETTYYLQKEGAISASVCEKQYDRTISFLGTKGGLQWWQSGAQSQFSDEFVEMIDARLDRPVSFQQYWFTEGRGFHPADDEVRVS